MLLTMINMLSPSHQRIFALLHSVEGNSMWAMAIQNVLKKPSGKKVRELIEQLSSQQEDNFEMLFKIIGFDLIKLNK